MEDKAKRYARLKYRLAIIDLAYLLFLLALLQFSGFNIRLKEACENISSNQTILIWIYTALLFILYSGLSFFLDFYRSFIVEHSFGLSNQKIGAFLSDYLKGNVLGLIFFLIL